MTDPGLEVHLLGPLQVRRADGSTVPAAAWRTGKTMDLLRSLAVRPATLVDRDLLRERLWPSADPAHGRTSLRTAASQIRRAVGSNCVERRFGGLALTGARVDVATYRELAAQAGAAHLRGAFEQVVSLVRRAEEVYVEDFHAYDDESVWAVDVRESLRAERAALLVDGAQAASTVRLPREAICFATAALRVDECAEAPHRVLLESYAQIGEVDRALRAYERCRRVLAESVGADPSPLTQATHLRVLRGEVRPVP